MRYLSLDEAGERVRRSARALRALIHAGRLPAVKVGKSYVITEEDLLALFRPVLRPHMGIERGESPRSREARQLSQAGFVDRGA
jgi:excisionase family DNA binding protein